MPDTLFKAFRSLRRRFHGTGLGRIPGVKGLYNCIYRAVRPNHIVLAEVQGSKMYVDPRETIHHPQMLLHGVVDPGQTELFKRLVKPGMVVIDIGANIGYYTCLAARLVGDSGHVYCFEPAPKNFELLRRNIEVNGYRNITAVNKGVARHTGRLRLYLHKESGLCHSLAPQNPDSSGPFVEVEVVGLDEYFESEARHQRVHLIKMDAECAEGLILGGAQRLLSHPGITIFMEFNAPLLPNMGTDPKQLLEMIGRLGFALNLTDANTGGVEPISIDAAHALSMRLGGHIELLLQK